MSASESSRIRRDVARNRAAILAAARTLFEADGAQVALEDVARAAGLSRTSLSRHFPERADLVAALWEADVERIEEVAADIEDDPAGLIAVLDHILDQQVDRIALHPSRDQITGPQLAPLVERIRVALDAPLRRAQAAKLVRPDVDLDDVLAVIDMCSNSIVQAQHRADREVVRRRVRRLVFPGLFTVEI